MMLKQLFAEYLGMTVSAVAIISAVGGYAATLASEADLIELKKEMTTIHKTDIKHVTVQIMQKNVNDYTDKIDELQLKPNRTQYENNLLELNKNKQQVEQKKLEAYLKQ